MNQRERENVVEKPLKKTNKKVGDFGISRVVCTAKLYNPSTIKISLFFGQ